MTKYRINSAIGVRDISTGSLFNRQTGEQFAVSEAVITLLSFFSEPEDFNLVAQNHSESPADVDGILIFLQSLVDQGLLVDANQKPSSKSESLADKVLVAFPDSTFFGVPARSFDDLESDSVCFVGVPFDLGTTGFPGARFGPNEIRRITTTNFEYLERIDGRGCTGWHRDLFQTKKGEGLHIRDVGDILFDVGEITENIISRISETVKKLHFKNTFPVVVGGDHSITYGVLVANQHQFEGTGLIHIDAHTDLADLIPNICHHHGNYVTRLFDEEVIDYVLQFGPRGNCGKLLDSEKYHVIPGGDNERNVESIDSKGLKWHISVDIDILDPSIAPGTGTPVPNGWNLSSLLDCITTCMAHFDVISADLVEVNPMRDFNEQTLRVGQEILLTFLEGARQQTVAE